MHLHFNTHTHSRRPLSKNCFFVDLYVRDSNHLAISMYERLGYVVYRRVIDYYTSSVSAAVKPSDYGDGLYDDGGGGGNSLDNTSSGVIATPAEPQDEDGLDMRKSLSADPQRRSMVPLSHPVNVYDLCE